MDIVLTKKVLLNKRLLGVEKISLIYSFLTAILIVCLYPRMDHPMQMLVERLAIVGITLALVFIGSWWPSKFTTLVRVAFQMSLLSYWYPDTYEFNRLFDNLDHVFASWEQSLIGFQPAITFRVNFSDISWSEAFNLGYFAYYPMIGLVVFMYFFKRFQEFTKVAYILVGAFFLYYFIYIFLPVVGPQYYFPAIGFDNVLNGIFPAVGDYFDHSQELLPNTGCDQGVFYELVESSQAAGERPTAAFPSSHVGISTIIMILIWRISRTTFGALFPFYVLLCGATVYIQAHYLIDVFAGWVTAFPIYGVVLWSYNKWFKQSESKRMAFSSK